MCASIGQSDLEAILKKLNLGNSNVTLNLVVVDGHSQSSKVEVNKCDMPDSQRQHAIRVFDEAADKGLGNFAMAEYAKKAFDAAYPDCWSCVVGSSFSSTLQNPPGAYFSGRVNGKIVALFKGSS